MLGLLSSRTWAMGFLALWVVPISASAIPVARLQLWSDPGDPIGHGQTYDLLYETPPDSVGATLRGYSTLSEIELYLTKDGFQTSLAFSTANLGVPLQPRITYTDAQAYPYESPGHPGLSIGFHALTPDTLTGQFTIDEASFVLGPPVGTLLSLVADFEIHDSGNPPALHGHIEYRLSGIPEPTSGSLLALGLAGIAARRRAAFEVSNAHSVIGTSLENVSEGGADTNEPA
ncbi:MAG TPA: PEP-CTERM sorting domain-containing protein [Myxococcota bacterium]|nr:PEP-CTERM sorting domain-containing protein [Myxococcota bacterium]